MHTYTAAPDVDVVTSTATIADFGQLAINAFVIHADEPVLVDTGLCGGERRLHDDIALGDRSGGPALDLADAHRLRPHRFVASPARRERTAPRDHQLPGGGHHGSVGAAADGPGVPGQSGPGGRRGRPDPDRSAASRLRQSDHDRSARRPFGHLLQFGLLRGPLGRGAGVRGRCASRCAPSGPGLLGHSGLVVAAHGRPCRVRLGAGPRPLSRAHAWS